ncbi:exodeoxyribonuclease VII large subunit [Schwartzia sp. (in: firmicutes)]
MVHSVSEVNRFIKGLLDHQGLLKNIAVRGEVSNFKRYPSGHCYFSIKDAQSNLKCVMFKSNASRLLFEPQNGIQVIVTGSISVYERDGVYQLYAEALVPEGKGSLAAAFEQLKEKLTAEGLFEASRKKELVPFPKKIGIVTSAAGAVLHDIYRVVKRRDPSVQLVLYPVQVQGDMAAKEISEGIRFFNTDYPVDTLIVGRGGGSMEDLWAFNEEPVVRAVAASAIPVISAVGHETDYTLCDFAADVRAATPSQAGEFAVRDRQELIQYLDSLAVRLDVIRRRWMDIKRQSLLTVVSRPVFQRPMQRLELRIQRLRELRGKLDNLRDFYMQKKKSSLNTAMQRLDMMSPVYVLRRGYGFIADEKGRSVRKISQVKKDMKLKITLTDGTFMSKVESVGQEGNDA